jgi:hypothetical protein
MGEGDMKDDQVTVPMLARELQMVSAELQRHVTDCMEERRETNVAIKALTASINLMLPFANGAGAVFRLGRRGLLAVTVGALTAFGGLAVQNLLFHHESIQKADQVAAVAHSADQHVQTGQAVIERRLDTLTPPAPIAKTH